MPPLTAEQVAAWSEYNDAQWGRLRLELIWAALERHVPLPPARVLDVGCGLAETALRLARLGSDVTAVDPSEAMLAEARARADADARWRIADAETVADTLAGERFDLVLCHNVLGYVPDPAATTAALASLLSPGGTLSLTVANRLAEPLRAAFMRRDLAEATAAVENGGTRRHSPTLGVEMGMTDPDEARGWLGAAGLELVALAGHRILNDYLPREVERGDAILRLELALSERDPYRQVAPFLHLLGRQRQGRG